MLGIKNIIFDLGGVIINLDNRRTEDAFTAMGVQRFSDYFASGHAASFFKEYEIGKISDQQFISSLRGLIGLSVPDEALIKGWNALLLDFPPERLQLLKDLRKTYRLFLFSNTNSLHLAALNEIYAKTNTTCRLDDHFERAYYSHTLGMRKPDTEAFQYILRENGLDGKETLFVDDAKVNVEGAEAAGLKGLYLRPGTTIMDFQW